MKSVEILDEKTVRAFISGDQNAFEKVYTTFQKYVFKLAYQFFQNEEQAKDIVQETFMKAYMRRKQLKNPEAILVWLNRICYTTCLDVYRKKRVDSSGYIIDDISEKIDVLDSSQDCDMTKELQVQDAKNEIVKILDELKPDFKTIAYLRFFEELKHKEIAEIMNIDVGTVGTYIQRARKQIVEKLNKRGFSKNSCLSIVTIPFLVDFYKEFDATFPILDDINSLEIEKNIKSATRKKGSTSMISSYLFIAMSVIMATGVMAYKDKKINDTLNPSLLPASIVDIQYNKELTNQPLKINVEVSSDVYDYILINGKETSRVAKNGNYLIELIHDGSTVDRRNVSITNIDRDIPIVVKETYDGKKVVLRLEDKDSAINFNQITLSTDGSINNAFVIDEQQGTITIEKNISQNNTLKVPDIAGNILNVKVSFY